MIEIWKDIEGFDGVFMVSSLGRVKSMDREVSWYRKDMPDKLITRVFKGRVLILKKVEDGYLEAHLRYGDINKHVRVHKLVAMSFLSNEDNLPVIDHIDDDKTNNRVDNLQWCTVSFNTKKAINLVSGNQRYIVKLEDSIKDETRCMLSAGDSVRQIARVLGISQRSIARIRDGLI